MQKEIGMYTQVGNLQDGPSAMGGKRKNERRLEEKEN